MSIEKIIEDWQSKPIDASFFHGNPSIKLRPEDYAIGLKEKNQIDPNGAFILHPQSGYYLVLSATKKSKRIASAILSFGLSNDESTCYQIQGVRGRYRELSPLKWNLALAKSWIDFSKKAELKRLIIPSYLEVEGLMEENVESLTKLYVGTANNFGFQFNKSCNQYHLEIKR